MLVVHVPHASLEIPEDVWPEFTVPREEVIVEARASADLYTDLMAREAWPSATIVEATVSRIVVDVERYDDDSAEEMAREGRGVLYTHSGQRERIRSTPSPARREELLERYYRPHWYELRRKVAGAVLIDLHTYPAEIWPIEQHADGPRPEIDIGWTEGVTPMVWVAQLTRHFRSHGYTVEENTPYVGVIDAGAAAAVMIEIRRDAVGTPGDARWARLIAALRTVPLQAHP